MKRQNKTDYDRREIDAGYKLVKKIIKAKVITDREACHLAVLYENGAYNLAAICRRKVEFAKNNENYLGNKFSLLLDYISKVYSRR